MMPPGSVSVWLEHLRAGDPAAAGPLWERYFHRLADLARARLGNGRGLGADEEDVALSAFHSFYRAAAAGRFPRLDDRNDLWLLLVTITARKAARLQRDSRRLKRGGGEVLDEAAVARDGPANLDLVAAAPDPTPAFAAEVADECRRLLGRLADDDLRAVALLKMEEYTTVEIATRVGRAPRSVERMLQLIRALWERECVS
jgi:DNA-directed RNA polymerase specialized sigma24 family protein